MNTDAPLETEEFTDARPILLWYWHRSVALQQSYGDTECFLKKCANDTKFLSRIIGSLKQIVQDKLTR